MCSRATSHPTQFCCSTDLFANSNVFLKMCRNPIQTVNPPPSVLAVNQPFPTLNDFKQFNSLSTTMLLLGLTMFTFDIFSIHFHIFFIFFLNFFIIKLFSFFVFWFLFFLQLSLQSH